MITVVAQTSAGSSDFNNVTTSGIVTTGADGLYIAAASEGGGTISDNKGNTWTLRAVVLNSFNRVELYEATNRPVVVGTGHTFTMSTSGAVPAIAVLAVAGAKTSAQAFDQQNTQANDLTAALATNNITPAEANEILVACVGVDAASIGNVSSIDQSFTIASTTNVGAGHCGVSIAYLIQGAAATRGPTWTLSVASACAAAIASFKAAPSTATGNFFPFF